MIERSIHAITVAGAGAATAIAALRPDLFELLLRKDDGDGGGLVEQLTVVVLVPGIAAAWYALARWRRASAPVWKL